MILKVDSYFNVIVKSTTIYVYDDDEMYSLDKKDILCKDNTCKLTRCAAENPVANREDAMENFIVGCLISYVRGERDTVANLVW